MRKWWWLLIIPVFAATAIILPREKRSEMVPGESTIQAQEINPYTIEGMKARTYDSDISRENLVRQTSGFTSYKISFESDRLKQYALMNVPKGASPEGGWPVVVVNHGYIEPLVYSTENSYINTSAYFADAGFLVVKPDYRGHDNSDGEAEGLLSRINYAVDVLNLLAGIRKLPEANEKQIFMYGHSMGGDVTLRVLEICPDCAAAATLWAPAVTEFPETFMYFARRGNIADPTRTARLERRQRELAENFKPEEYSQVSSLANTALVKVSLNIQHGTADESVPFEWGMALAARFEKKGVEHNFYSYIGDNHDIAGNWGTALGRDFGLFRSVTGS